MKYFVLAFSFVVGLLSSCSSKNEMLLSSFPKTFKGHFEILSSELIGYNYINDMFVSRDYVIVTCYDMESRTFVHLFDKKDFRSRDFIREGRGEGEMVYGSQSYTLVDNQIIIVDPKQNRQILFNIDSLLLKGIDSWEIDYVDVPKWNYAIHYLGDCSYFCLNERPPLSKDTSSVHRLGIYRDGVCVSYDDWAPIEDMFMRFRSSVITKIDVNHARQRVVLASPYGSEMEILSVKNGVLDRLGFCSYEKTDFKGEKGIEYNENTISGYGDIHSTDDFVIGVFDGHKSLDIKTKVPVVDMFKEICIFTWNAEPVARVSADVRVETICYDDTEKNFYAVITDVEGREFLARLSFDLDTLK